MENIVIIGNGGLAREVLWLIEEINGIFPLWNFVGFVDKKNDDISNIIDEDDFLKNVDKETYAICAISEPRIRKKVVDKFKNNKFIRFATLIHPIANVSDISIIKEGSVIFANNIVSVNSQIGEHVFINFGCYIGHDSKIGDFVTINTNSKVSGNVYIGDSSLIGVGSIILEKIRIGKQSKVCAGSVVFRDVRDNCIVIGNPSREILKNSE